MGNNPLPAASATAAKFKPQSVYLIVYDDGGKRGLSFRVAQYHGQDFWEDQGATLSGTTPNGWRNFKEDKILIFQEIESSDAQALVSRLYNGSAPRYYKEVDKSGNLIPPSSPPIPNNPVDPNDFDIDFEQENP